MNEPKQVNRKKPEARDVTVECRTTASERQAFQDAADLAGIGLSTWIRERLRQTAIKELEDAGRPIAFIPETFAL